MTSSPLAKLALAAAIVLSLAMLGCFLFIPGDALDVTIIYQEF